MQGILVRLVSGAEVFTTKVLAGQRREGPEVRDSGLDVAQEAKLISTWILRISQVNQDDEDLQQHNPLVSFLRSILQGI